MKKESEIVELLQKYMAAYPNATMPDVTCAIYGRALLPLELEEINAAMLKLLRTCKFFPTVAEIFEAAESIREQAKGEVVPTAAEAWGEVMQLVRRKGLYQSWDYSHPAVGRTVKLFGKEELCMLEESAVNTARAQFMRMFQEICTREKNQKNIEAVLDVLPATREKIQGTVIKLAEKLGGKRSRDVKAI